MAKYLSGAVTAAGLTLLFQAVTVGAIAFKTGIFGASEPIYLLDGMDYCPFRLTIGQYACLTMLGWMLCAVILSVILNTISALSRNSVISYGVGAVVLGGSGWNPLVPVALVLGYTLPVILLAQRRHQRGL